jgi:hypothetical protein
VYRALQSFGAQLQDLSERALGRPRDLADLELLG